MNQSGPPSQKSHDVVGSCLGKYPTENRTGDTTRDQGQSSTLYLNGGTGGKDDSRTDAEDVQRVVYYLSNSLQLIQNPAGYRLVSDDLRVLMILKWMKYYTWYPDKTGRTKFGASRAELKRKLNLPKELHHRVSEILYQKFLTLQRLELVTLKNGLYIYQALTDRWLQREWDGKLASASLSNVSVLVLP